MHRNGENSVQKRLRFRNQTSLAIAGNDMTVVADIDKTLETLQKGIASINLELAVVDNQRVKIVARLKTAHLPKETPSRLGSHPESLGQREERTRLVALIVHFTYLNSVNHHAEYAERVPATHVTA